MMARRAAQRYPGSELEAQMADKKPGGPLPKQTGTQQKPAGAGGPATKPVIPGKGGKGGGKK